MKHSSLCLIHITLETDVLDYAAKYKLRFTLSSHLETYDCKAKRLWAHPLWFKCFAKILNLLLRKNISKTVKNFDNIWQWVIWKPIIWTFDSRKRVKHFVFPKQNFKNRGRTNGRPRNAQVLANPNCTLTAYEWTNINRDRRVQEATMQCLMLRSSTGFWISSFDIVIVYKIK